MSLWDLGGAQEFLTMLPMVCADAVAILFLFDLTNSASLSSVKAWYKEVRRLNRTALPMLVGTKFDMFYENMSAEEQASTVKQARKYSKAMKAPLIFCSSARSINIAKLFKLLFCRVFDVPITLAPITGDGEPLLEWSATEE